jgi:hypothetical protein
VLPGFDSALFCGGFAEMQKAANLPAELRQGNIFIG